MSRPTVRNLLFAMTLVATILTPAAGHAAILLETASPGPEDGFYGIGLYENTNHPGVRFYVSQPTAVTKITLRLAPVGGTCFVAINPLSSATAFPSFEDLHDYVFAGLLQAPTATSDVSLATNFVLQPGYYSLMAGGGRFGASGDPCYLKRNNFDIGVPSYFSYQSIPKFYNGGFSGVRMVIEGEPLTDTTPPTISVLGVGTAGASNGLPYLRVQVTDLDSGALKVQLTANSNNCHLEYPLGTRVVTAGTPRPHTLILPSGVGSIIVYAVKDTNSTARVEVRAWDVANNTALADPVIANLEIKQGRQLSRTFTGIPAEEHYITLQNGSPGLTAATLWVNGKVVWRGNVTEGQVVTLNVAERMRPGKRNTVRITATGPKGAKAVLLIGDASLAGGGATGAASATRRLNTEFSR